MKAHRTIRYRLHPRSKAKAEKLHGLAGACRHAWNHFVGKLRDDYRFYGKSDFRWYSVGKLFTVYRKHTQPWLQDYSSKIVRLSLKPIEINYRQFFKSQGGLPKFKAHYDHVPSFPLSGQAFKLNGNSLHIEKIGQVTLTGHSPYPDSKPVSGTIKYETGKWYAYIVHEVEVTSLPASLNPVGIDRNVGQITLSDGEVFYLPVNERLEARKRRYQRMMARRQAGSRKQGIRPSNRYLKAKHHFNQTVQKITQRKNNFCHQTSREIANKYNLVYLEDLNIQGMTASAKGDTESPGRNVKQKAGLNRSILQSSWGKLEQCLSYKSNVQKVPAPYTSQRCSECGHTEKGNRKTQAEFVCLSCGYSGNADYNAALNILASGTGATVRGGGVEVKRPVKREMGTGCDCVPSI